MVSGLFLFGYVTVLLPVVLYTGSLALITMFDLNISIWVVAAAIGLLGSSYAIFGGLKSVAVSDTLNGIGLLIGGLMIPILALVSLGGGSFFEGLSILGSENPEYLRVLTQENLEGKQVSVPWPTLLTGMMFIQIFYWSTNQVIVQRAMAAKSLAEGQKGVLFASAMKLVGPLMLCLPGIIALHMPDLIIEKQDQVYGAVVRHVLPDWSLGLFAAVLMGSILSSFNSALNSASTLFSLHFIRAT
jgi:SSS family solute:Na+ symporter